MTMLMRWNSQTMTQRQRGAASSAQLSRQSAGCPSQALHMFCPLVCLLPHAIVCTLLA